MKQKLVFLLLEYQPFSVAQFTHYLLLGVSNSEITYIVSGGALNSTHSLTHYLQFEQQKKTIQTRITTHTALNITQ